MDAVQRQLEIEISKLKRSQQYTEKRIQELEAKEKNHEERNLKRKRASENGEEDPSNKKLRSVVTVAERSPSPERRPNLRLSSQDERRNRRLFGLLQGTLAKFSEEKKEEENKETV
jgi:hypothetical protein